MNVMSASAAPVSRPAAPPLAVSWLRVARAEWIKLSTIRSAIFLLCAAALLIVGVWSLAAFGFASSSGGNAVGVVLNPYSVGLTTSVGLAQLAVGVLGVVFVTNEYSTGMIRATFAAVPTRTPVLLGKAAVLILATFVVTFLAILAAFFISSAILSSASFARPISAPGMLRALLGGGLYLAGIAVIGACLGWLLRSAAGAIATFVALVILAPILLPVIPLDAVKTISDYLPSTMGQQMFRLPGFFDDLTKSDIDPWLGFAIFVGYAVIGLVAAAGLVRSRDA